MPALWNSDGDIKFLNFISNKYFAGVPAGALNNFDPANPTIGSWLINHAFSPTEAFLSSTYYWIYFPSVPGTPTENETCTGQVAGGNRRFALYLNRDYGLINQNQSNNFVYTNDSGASEVSFSENWSGLIIENNIDVQSRYNYFTFGAKSPTTLVLTNFRTRGTVGDYLTDYDNCCTIIFGWLHDGIFPTPPTDESQRYNNFFMLELRDYYLNNYVTHYVVRRPNAKGSTGTVNMNVLRHLEINCQTGNYTPGFFLTDLVLQENNVASNYQPQGKVDNRVACMGRGNFEVGKIYRVTNPFDRIGTEDWLCCGRIFPSSYTFTAWTPGSGNVDYHAWAPNELDFFMVRVYTEAD